MEGQREGMREGRAEGEGQKEKEREREEGKERKKLGSASLGAECCRPRMQMKSPQLLAPWLSFTHRG